MLDQKIRPRPSFLFWGHARARRREKKKIHIDLRDLIVKLPESKFTRVGMNGKMVGGQKGGNGNWHHGLHASHFDISLSGLYNEQSCPFLFGCVF